MSTVPGKFLDMAERIEHLEAVNAKLVEALEMVAKEFYALKYSRHGAIRSAIAEVLKLAKEGI